MAAGLAWFCIGCGAGDQEALPTDGPARVQNDIAYYPSFRVGTTFTDGVQNFVVNGSQPATIKKVEVLGATSGFEVLGAKAAGPHRRYATIESLSGYPPQDKRLGAIHRAVGFIVQPGPPGAELLIGITITKSGMQHRTGVRVVYSVGSRTYAIDYKSAIVNCPHGDSLDTCRASIARTAAP